MKHDSFYPIESGVKVMAACFEWGEDGTVEVSGLNWYYFPIRTSLAGRPMGELRSASMDRCQGAAVRSAGTCECQIVDETGRNEIALLNGMEAREIIIAFKERRAKPRDPEPASTEEEKLEKTAGCGIAP